MDKPDNHCPTCGAKVKVVGKTTMHYEPITPLVFDTNQEHCKHHCTRTMKGMDIYCSNCNQKLDNELSEWGHGWHQGYKDGLKQSSALLFIANHSTILKQPEWKL